MFTCTVKMCFFFQTDSFDSRKLNIIILMINQAKNADEYALTVKNGNRRHVTILKTLWENMKVIMFAKFQVNMWTIFISWSTPEKSKCLLSKTSLHIYIYISYLLFYNIFSVTLSQVTIGIPLKSFGRDLFHL